MFANMKETGTLVNVDEGSHSSPRYSNVNEAALLQRFGVKEAEAEGSKESIMFGKSESLQSPVLVRRVPKHQLFSVDAARREIAALKSVQDDTVPALVEELDTESALWYVMESRPGLSLRSGIESHGGLPEDAVKSIVSQLFSGVASIFFVGLANLKINSDTIFIDNNGRVTIQDFRYAFEYGTERDENGLYAATSEKVGDDIYTAPEVFRSIKYNARKAVIWSCGVLVYYMTTGQTDKLAGLGHASYDDLASYNDVPEKGSSSRRKLSTVALPVIPYPNNRFAVPNWCRDIISKMLRPNPLQRAELIEVAAKVPKEIVAKEARPLMELAWVDYKQHVGPLAGLEMTDVSDKASSMFSFSRFSTFSKDSLGPLLPGRRRRTVINDNAVEYQRSSGSPGKRRHTIFS